MATKTVRGIKIRYAEQGENDFVGYVHRRHSVRAVFNALGAEGNTIELGQSRVPNHFKVRWYRELDDCNAYYS